jgi:hypothetical protein
MKCPRCQAESNAGARLPELWHPCHAGQEVLPMLFNLGETTGNIWMVSLKSR